MPTLDQSIINEINERVAQIRKKADERVKKAEEARDMLAETVKAYAIENDRLWKTIRTVSNSLELSQMALHSEIYKKGN